MSDLVERLRKGTYYGLEPYEAANEIERLTRELAQHQAVIAEQKETIERITKSSSNRLVGLCKCGIERDKQSDLIEKLGDALKWSWQNLYSMADPAKVIETEEALAAYQQWKEGK